MPGGYHLDSSCRGGVQQGTMPQFNPNPHRRLGVIGDSGGEGYATAERQLMDATVLSESPLDQPHTVRSMAARFRQAPVVTHGASTKEKEAGTSMVTEQEPPPLDAVRSLGNSSTYLRYLRYTPGDLRLYDAVLRSVWTLLQGLD